MADEDDDRDPELTGADAIANAASTRDPSEATQHNALAFFMGDAPPPGRDTRIQLNVDFGEPDAPNFQRCVFRTLAQEEIVKAEMEATIRDEETGAVTRVDPFIRWSWAFAIACVEPSLGHALSARRQNLQAKLSSLTAGSEEATAVEKELLRLTDSAALVREVFRFQPGVLQHAVIEVERRSRLGDDPKKAVREIEAGKDSPS